MKGILFTEDMFRAIIEGRKTETRRTGGLEQINQHPDKCTFRGTVTNPESLIQLIPRKSKRLKGEYYRFSVPYPEFCDRAKRQIFLKPRYQKTDVVYLKEPYCQIDEISPIHYKFNNKENQTGYPWMNKMFMAAKYARYFIKVIEVKPERLQEITIKGAIKEGVKPFSGKYGSFNSPLGSFKRLWMSVNGSDSWEKNPWVWVYKFELLTQEETQQQIKQLQLTA